MSFTDFFKQATKHSPYPYQSKLAEAAHMPMLLKVPTGAGKTEAAILSWLYRALEHPDLDVQRTTPRRLVYCLPMRTLVEQTVGRVNDWLAALDLNCLDKADAVTVVTLMGGTPRNQWYLEPERRAIIVGTQDMLLSRALNRGYGNSPFGWPVEYGLLNNDCLWVMDEVQLMANGLPTSTQLAGLRLKLKTFGPSRSLWMSATAKPQWLETIDHKAPKQSHVWTLGYDDLSAPNLDKRHNAQKVVTEISAIVGKNNNRDMAQFIADKHKAGTLTLAIVNTVERAQGIYKALQNRRQGRVDADTMLIHSRFRMRERERQRQSLAQDVEVSGPGKIVVATQAVEAGVDISARTLITELAPWPSMVQRFGRCNRAGEDENGDIFWVDVGERKQDTAPYEPEDMEHARKLMKKLEKESAGPSDIDRLGDVIDDADHLIVIRKRDVEGLFDTTPDLSGGYLDVSQYVRGGEERDVAVFWRNIPKNGPEDDEPKPQYDEIVSVSLGAKGILGYLKNSERQAWRWDVLDAGWVEVRRNEIYPGMTLMLDAKRGSYSSEFGWDPSSKQEVDVIAEHGGEPEDSQSSDRNSTSLKRWITLSDHTRRVESEVEKILSAISAWIDDPEILKVVRTAVLHHDIGKAHQAFQEMLRKDGECPPEEGVLLAKGRGNGRMDRQRRHFRHELGSALSVLQHTDGLEGIYKDLAAFLVAAHHGKIRLAVRSLPGPRKANRESNPTAEYLLGYKIAEPETLPSVDLGEGLHIGETVLDMSMAQIGLDNEGRHSWLERSLGLLEWLGPFRLAFLEAIIRAADMRASRDENQEFSSTTF